MPILISPDERLIASSNVRLYFLTFGTLIITPEVGVSFIHKGIGQYLQLYSIYEPRVNESEFHFIKGWLDNNKGWS